MEFVIANLPILLLFLAGIALLIVEAFIPGFGAAGISGMAAGLGAIVLTWINHGAVKALGLTVVFLAILAIVVTMSLRSAAKGRLSKSRIVLNESESNNDGYTAADDLQVFVGKEGKAVTKLRPVGSADFDGVRLNVVSDGEFIEAGTVVRVVRTEGSRVLVKPVEG